MTGSPERPLLLRGELQRFAVYAMATRFELVLEAPFDAGPAAEEALEEIELAHARLSRFERASWVSHLRRTCAKVPALLDLDQVELFQTALEIERGTQGAFSPTHEQSGVLELRGDRLRSRVAEPPIDLGAIAKGHALDLAARVLRGAGIERALLHGGTSTILALGGPFRVALGSTNSGITFELEDCALSVSAQSRQDSPDASAAPPSYHVTDGRRGQPAAFDTPVVALGPSGLLCDAWSTAALALAPARPCSSLLDAHGIELHFPVLSPSEAPCSDPTVETS